MSGETTAVETLLRRERLIVLAGLLLITALAGCWILIGSGTGMSTFAMTTWRFPPPVARRHGRELDARLCARDVLHVVDHDDRHDDAERCSNDLLYGRAYRHEQRQGKLPIGIVPTFVFALGYFLSWAVFSLIATGLQWGLERAGLVHQMMMWSISPIFTAALLIAAGLYQLTPLKTRLSGALPITGPVPCAALQARRSGAIRLGWKHGLYCLGCCWFLMALLFAGGIMNLVWIAGLAIYVLIEKVAPQGQLIARVAGIAMVVVGLWVAVGSYVA